MYAKAPSRAKALCKERAMLDTELDQLLVQLGDVALDGGGHRVPEKVEARCRVALQLEIERERDRRRDRRHLRRTVVVPLAAVLVAGAGAVGYAALTPSSTSSAGIECHTGTTLDSSGTITSLDGQAATASCARLWTRGLVSDGAKAPPAALHACVQNDGQGAIHVFASDDPTVCSKAGLRDDPAAGTDPDAAGYGRFATTLNEQLNTPAFACPTADRLRQLVESALRANRLTGWSIIDAGGYDRARPCASLSLDSRARTATLSPVAS
jgi:hypothetical protein